MQHPARRRVFGGALAMLAVALVATSLVWHTAEPEPPSTTSPRPTGLPLDDVLHLAVGLVAVVIALTVVTVAGRAAAPGARRAVRALRAWHQGRRERQQHRASTDDSRQGTRPRTRPTMRRLALTLILCMTVVVAVVAIVALVINFQHGRELAIINREVGWRSLLWPLAVDGLMIAASLVGLVRRLLGLSVGFRARASFVAGIAASAAANIVLALHSELSGWALVERIGVMTWPTIALLLSHEVGLQMVRYYAHALDVFGIEQPDPALIEAQQAQAAAEADLRAVTTATQHQLTAIQAQTDQAVQAARAELADAREHQAVELKKANTEAQQRIDSLAQEHRAELDRVEATNARLHRQLTEAQQAVSGLTRERDTLHNELTELEQAADQATERLTGDYAHLRNLALRYVEERRADGEIGSLSVETARVLGISLRWVQKHVPEATITDRPPRQMQLQPA